MITFIKKDIVKKLRENQILFLGIFIIKQKKYASDYVRYINYFIDITV